MTFETFAEGAVSMSDSMNAAEGQVTCRFYPVKVPVGNTLGKGVGESKIFFDPNIVGCNKCDKSWTDSITTTQFALDNSDCSKSVKLGVLYTASGGKLTQYVNSAFCVIEAVGSIEGEQNIYCNGKRKSGNHVNCSWFNGIGHSESFHTHIY